MQPVLKELMSIKGLILLIALVALGLSITAVVQGGCGSSFANTLSLIPTTELSVPYVKYIIKNRFVKGTNKISVDVNWICENISPLTPGPCTDPGIVMRNMPLNELVDALNTRARYDNPPTTVSIETDWVCKHVRAPPDISCIKSRVVNQ
jgi:hypothetical protein